MKLITAMMQPHKLGDVKKALSESEVDKMTVTNVLGCGRQGGFSGTYRGVVHEVNLVKKVRLEIVVNDSFLDKTVNAIIEAARSGNIGDGKIFISTLDDCIRIRTGERGKEAVG